MPEEPDEVQFLKNKIRKLEEDLESQTRLLFKIADILGDFKINNTENTITFQKRERKPSPNAGK